MHNFTIIGGALGLLLFLPLCISILTKKSVQNLLTFFLWTLIDVITFVATYMEGGNYLQALMYATGGATTVTCILYAGNKPKWTGFETLITVLVIISIMVWRHTTNTAAVIATICALVISSVPQIVDTWQNPKATPTLLYLGMTISNLLAALGGKEFSVVEVGYQLAGAFVCGIVFILCVWDKIKPSAKFWSDVGHYDRNNGFW